MPASIELIAYLFVLVLCIIAFTRVTRAYKISKETLSAYEIIDLAKIFMITFGFIIIKLTIDYIFILGYLADSIYKIFSVFAALIILTSIMFSVRILINLTKRVQ